MSDLARFMVEDDANGEPTLWLVIGTDVDYPRPVLTRSDLHCNMRHLWHAIIARILDGDKS